MPKSRLPRTSARDAPENLAMVVEEVDEALERFGIDAARFYSALGWGNTALTAGLFLYWAPEHIRALTQHFDNLIRGAIVQPPEVPQLLRRLLGPDPDIEPLFLAALFLLPRTGWVLCLLPAQRRNGGRPDRRPVEVRKPLARWRQCPPPLQAGDDHEVRAEGAGVLVRRLTP